MRYSIICLFLFFVSSFAIAQKSELKKATKKSPNRSGVYTATFKKMHKEKDIRNWLSKNNYVLTNSKKGNFNAFGRVVRGTKSVSFMNRAKYAQLQEQKRQQRLATRQSRSSGSSVDWGQAAKVGAVVVGVAVVAKGIASLFKSAAGSSSYSGSSSYNSSAYSSNASTSTKSKPTPCIKSSSKTSSKAYECGLEFPLTNVKCHGGNEKTYYYVPKYCGTPMLGTGKGYWKYNGLLYPDKWLGKDYDTAMKKLCDCN